MKLINKWTYKVYRQFQETPGAAAVMQLIYHKIFPLLKKEMRSYQYNPTKEKPLEVHTEEKKSLKELNIAIICDEMTFRGFERECNFYFVTPSNWMSIFREIKPDLFFCESAWEGIEAYHNCWKAKIYKSGRAGFENRKDLINILDFCKRSNIPTVFWNKEDPTYFGDRDHDFVDTALLFDYIYTTAEECISLYNERGHQRVNTLMFGFEARLFNPIGKKGHSKEAVFAGSWYADQEQRCKDMSLLFDAVIGSGLNLKIYDRHWNSGDPLNQYPEEYKKYVHKGMSFKELNKVLKTAQFAININTVKDSKTMFARRVFEMMASDLIVISNESVGLQALFGEKIWFINEAFDLTRIEEYAKSNFREVFLNHTCRRRLLQVVTETGILKQEKAPSVVIIYNHEQQEIAVKNHFDKITYKEKIGVVYREEKYYTLAKDKCVEIINEISSGFVVWISDLKQLPDLELMISQFSYIDETCGIKEGVPRYTVIEDTVNTQTLFHGSMFHLINEDKASKLKKYLI